MKSNLIIVGNSTTAETVYKFVKTYNLFNVIGFAVHRKYYTTTSFLGKKNFILEDLDVSDEISLFIAMQWNKLNRDRRNVYERLKSKGFQFANLISPSAIIHGTLDGDNCWIADNVVLEQGVSIGFNTFIKAGVSIATRSIIGNHCFIGMHTVIGGASSVGSQTFVGLNSTIFDEVVIGDCCLIGACSVVKRNLQPYSKLVSKFNNTEIKTYKSNLEIEYKLQSKKNVR